MLFMAEDAFAQPVADSRRTINLEGSHPLPVGTIVIQQLTLDGSNMNIAQRMICSQ